MQDIETYPARFTNGELNCSLDLIKPDNEFVIPKFFFGVFEVLMY